MMKFSYKPASGPHQTPVDRASEVQPTFALKVFDHDGYVALSGLPIQLVAAVRRMNPTERSALRVSGSQREVEHVLVSALPVLGVSYNSVTGLNFAPHADVARFFDLVFTPEKASATPEQAEERPTELNEALQHLKQAGEALVPLLKREGLSLFKELKTLLK